MFENICYFHLVNYIWTSNSLQLPHNFFFFGNNFHHIGSCAELQQGCVYDSLTLFQQPEQYAIFYTNLKNIQYLISTQTIFNITDVRKYLRKYPPTPPYAAKKQLAAHLKTLGDKRASPPKPIVQTVYFYTHPFMSISCCQKAL